MPAIKIRENLWKQLLAAAQKRRQTPEMFTSRALRDALQELADEELLSSTVAEARRSPLRIADTEEAIRRYRRKKK